MSTLRLKIKGILTLPSKEFEEKNLAKIFVLLAPTYIAFLKNSFIYKL